MMSTERLNQSSDRIRESRKTMLETEELGVSILQDLHQQRQSLLHANNTVCLHNFGLNFLPLVYHFGFVLLDNSLHDKFHFFCLLIRIVG